MEDGGAIAPPFFRRAQRWLIAENQLLPSNRLSHCGGGGVPLWRLRAALDELTGTGTPNEMTGKGPAGQGSRYTDTEERALYIRHEERIQLGPHVETEIFQVTTRAKILVALNKPRSLYSVHMAVDPSGSQDATQNELLKMRDEGLVKFDIHKGHWSKAPA
jgi:hypothetical protein